MVKNNFQSNKVLDEKSISVATQAASLTLLLGQWRNGDRKVEAQLLEQIYPMLRALAANGLRKAGRLTLGPTDLAHEAYLRLKDQDSYEWKDRSQFMAIVATVVRRVVVDYLRDRNADKRYGGKIAIDLDAQIASELSADAQAFGWIRADQALTQLEALDAECARVVELKLFSDLDAEQIAASCQISVATVGRHWRFAKAWLAKELAD